jgi:protein TonB
MAGQCLAMVSPHYPQLATKQETPAVLELEVEITRLGRVVPLRAVSGPPALENEAMNAVRLWRYRPYMHNGIAVDVTTQISVTFTPGKTGGVVSHPAG